MVLIYFFVFAFGAIIGSFLNVVILRYNTGASILSPGERSRCFSCGKTLVWQELIPIVSFLALRGRCSKCKSKISWQYPAVEILTGIIFLLLFLKMPGYGAMPGYDLLTFLYYAAIWSILIVITVYDLKHKIIPDGMVYAFILLSVGYFFFSYFTGSGAMFPVADFLAGIVFFAFFAGLWLISGGRWLGFGDAKLVLGVGFFLGLAEGLSALMLAFWIGAAVSIIFLLSGNLVPRLRLLSGLQNLTMKSEIPFAPFIILGTAIAFFCSVDILGLSILF